MPQPQREPAAYVFQLTPEQEAKREETRAWFRGRVLAAEDALRRGELDVRSADGRLLVKGKLPAAPPRAPCVPPTGPSSR